MVCNSCPFSTAAAHQASAHAGMRPHACAYCPCSFGRGHELRLHVRAFHTAERPHLCPVCPRSFHSRSNLARHMVSHTDERPYRCRHCTRSYRSSSAVIYHEKRCTAPFREEEQSGGQSVA